MRFALPTIMIALAITYLAIDVFWFGLALLGLGLYILDDCLRKD